MAEASARPRALASAVALLAATGQTGSAKVRASAATIKNALLDSAVPTVSLSGVTVTGGRLDSKAALAK